jgi:hypothetical protein
MNAQRSYFYPSFDPKCWDITLVDDDESFVDMTITEALTVSMETTITDEAVRAADDGVAATRHQEDLDRAITKYMDTVINDEAVRAAIDAVTPPCHQEDLDRAIAESMATIVTNESASGAAKVAGGPLSGGPRPRRP